MLRFAELLDRLAYTPQRNAKLRLMADYFAAAPDPDRGWALAALTDGLPVSFPLRRTLAQLIEPRVDPELYRLSRDYVGDTAETVALLWPEPLVRPLAAPPRLGEIVEAMSQAGRDDLPGLLAGWLDALDANGRWALLKLLGGAPRVGVSARLAKSAVAAWAAKIDASITVDEIEEVWHGLSPPYAELFAWCGGHAARPETTGAPVFRPLMLAHALTDDDLAALDVADYVVEWKWDGVRIQIACGGGATRLYSRTGEDIGVAFPDISSSWSEEGVFDGELLIVREGVVAPFSDLQQRLNRKSVTSAMLTRFPAHVRLYDALMIGAEDVRSLPLEQRRHRLERWHAASPPPRTDISPLIDIADTAALQQIWHETRGNAIEGLMLKRRASPYLPGRPRGHWFKWKRAALVADCVLMYAQRGSGKRSSLHSDFTFGVWTDRSGALELVPVGKAYFGFTDAELADLDRWVRNNTLERFGPVRRVAPGLVLEVAFDALQRSPRHKSGLAMRFPRINRIRWDKPAAEADQLETLARLVE